MKKIVYKVYTYFKKITTFDQVINCNIEEVVRFFYFCMIFSRFGNI